MKKRNIYSRTLTVSICFILLLVLSDLMFVILSLANNNKLDSQMLYFVFAANIVVTVFSLFVQHGFYKRLQVKVVKPVKSVKNELERLVNGDFETPVFTDEVEGMQDIYLALEEIRKRLERFGTEQEEKREVKHTYVSGLLHDIATPVTRISGCASMICDGIVTSDEDIRKFAEMIVQNTEDIDIMLKNLAEIEKYDRAEIHSNLLPIDISYIISYYIEGLKLELSAMDTTIEYINRCTKKPICKIDVKSCKRVLMNLINNSIKYKKADVPSCLTITLETPENADYLLFSLADNGMGIEPGTEEKIFELFYRADTARRNSNTNNGIGLFVSAELMKANNSEMWAENNGDGLTVFVSIPLTDEAPIDWFEI